MDIVIAQHKGFELFYRADSDDQLWLLRRNISSGIVLPGSYISSDLVYDFKKYGGVDNFFTQVVIPKSNEILREYFPKEDAGTQPVPELPDDNYERLYAKLGMLKFNPVTEQVEYKE